MHVDAHRGSDRTARLAFAALMLANIFLALGPWLVRLADVGPVASAFWRMALAIPLLAWFALRSSGMGAALRPAFLAALLLGGLLFAADLAAWHYGILRTKLANATLFGNTSSFLFVLYGFLILRTMPRPLQGLALLLAVAGAALLMGASYELSPRNFTGDLFALLGGFFYALYLIVIDRVRRDLAPMPVLALVTIAAAPPLLLAALAFGEQVWPTNWTPLIILSLGSQVIGQGLLVYAMGHLRPAVVGIGLLTQPALTAVVGWLAYDETFGLADAAGALMICIALVLIRLPERRVATAGSAAH